MNKLKVILSAVLFLAFLPSCGKTEKNAENLKVTNYVSKQFSQKADSVSKTETVYVNLDSSGELRKITVSDWIHTDKSNVYVDDISILNNIKDIKGQNEPMINGENIRWNMDKKDLYYSGTSNKAPPILFEIEYYLDGAIMNPADIAGKSGEIAIKITIRNNLFKKILINGEEYFITLPVAVLGGLILSGDIFSDVSLKNASSFNDGSKQLVAFATVPGFNETFGFENNTAESVAEPFTAKEITVRARAENFTLDNIYLAVVPFATLNSDLMLPESVGDVGTALTVLRAFRNAIENLDPDRIIYSLISDEKKVGSLLGAVDDASELYANNKNIIELLGKYSTSENIATMQKLIETLNTPEVKAMLEVISDPEVQSFISGLPIIMENFGDVEPLLNELQKDLSRPEVQKELSDLPETLKILSKITDVLSENDRELDAIFDALDSDGAVSVESLLESITSEDMANLGNKYGDVVENSDLLFTIAEKWLEFGREYGLYSGKTDDMSFSLMFIYKTERIKNSIS